MCCVIKGCAAEPNITLTTWSRMMCHGGGSQSTPPRLLSPDQTSTIPSCLAHSSIHSSLSGPSFLCPQPHIASGAASLLPPFLSPSTATAHSLGMSQNLPHLMEGLSLASRPAPPSPRSTPSSNSNRLPPLMKKYMNPGLIRPPNAGLASHHEQAQRAALLDLAGVNTAIPKPSASKGSPRKPTQHTAHGIHGPAHATAARTQASSIVPASTHVRKAEKDAFGTYDGGFEADVEGKETVTGEAAKVLELQSAAG